MAKYILTSTLSSTTRPFYELSAVYGQAVGRLVWTMSTQTCQGILTQSRNEAVEALLDEARKINADAVLALQIQSMNTYAGNTVEILAIGTAIKYKQ